MWTSEGECSFLALECPQFDRVFPRGWHDAISGIFSRWILCACQPSACCREGVVQGPAVGTVADGLGTLFSSRVRATNRATGAERKEVVRDGLETERRARCMQWLDLVDVIGSHASSSCMTVNCDEESNMTTATDIFADGTAGALAREQVLHLCSLGVGCGA